MDREGDVDIDDQVKTDFLDRDMSMTLTSADRKLLPGWASINKEPTLPDYLLRHYWWAYVWAPAVWLFDHQPIINLIVFGQYRTLVSRFLEAMTPRGDGTNLLIASAYGCVVPELSDRLDGQSLTIIDVVPLQLERARRKIREARPVRDVHLTRMNAEHLAYEDNSHDRSLTFLLLHELPEDARRRALKEAIRIVRPGGELVLAEYGEATPTHIFHRARLCRWILGTVEPFLPGFWRQELDCLVDQCARYSGKRATCESTSLIFKGFYRVIRYRVTENRSLQTVRTDARIPGTVTETVSPPCTADEFR